MPQITTQWETPGKVLDVTTTGQPVSADPIIDGPVNVIETGTSFSFPGLTSTATAGIPVDANLGIYLIKRLHKKLADIQGGSPGRLSENEAFLMDLLLYSRAITMDKNALLKTISQPGCEGVRFYLCTKPNEVAEENDPKELLSFVTVGVDAHGADLGYVYKTDVADEIAADVYKVTTESLLSEFSAPPPAGDFTSTQAQTTYPLGNYAWV